MNDVASRLRVGVVIPAFNEQEILPRVLASTWPADVECIVVVDDGSADETSARALLARRESSTHIIVVRHEQNRGVGAAIASGYREVFARDFDVAVVVAADGQMRIDEIERLLKPIREGHADYVKGERMSDPELRARMPWSRIAGNLWFSALTSAAVGYPTRDSQCGYTAVTRKAFLNMRLDKIWRSYGYPNELIARAVKSGTKICEVPVTPVYADEQSGIRLRHVLFVVPAAVARAAFIARF